MDREYRLESDLIYHSLSAYCEHMAETLISTAYSPLLYDAVDFSTALFNSKGDLVAQNLGCPVHLAAIGATVRAVLREFRDDLAEGDVLLTNDPYIGGTHLGDFTFVSPIYNRDNKVEIIGFAATRIHVTDYGSAYPGGDHPAIDIFQEGLRIPPVKLYAKGRPDNNIIRLITANSRTPSWLEGDIRAAVAANNIGIKSYAALYARYGRDVFEKSLTHILDYSERMLRQGIRSIPDRIFSAEDYIDDDMITDAPVPIRVTIRVQGEDLIIDFSGTSGLVRGPLNRPKHAAVGDVAYAVKTLIDPDGPANDGMLRPLKIHIPENSLLDAKWPYPVGQGNLATTARITDVIWQALAPAFPEKVTGMLYGGCDSFAAFGKSVVSQESWTLVDLPAGGWGARHNKDGVSALWHLLGNCQDTQIEIIEAFYPILMLHRRLRTDSGGAGKFRGGLGSVNAYKLLEPAILNLCVNRARQGPPGVFGGISGSPGRIKLVEANGQSVVICGLDENGIYRGWGKVLEANAGSVVIIESAGGGGYGDPLERDPQLVYRDVLDGYVSRDAAEKVYGVVITQDNSGRLILDLKATERLRQKLSSDRSQTSGHRLMTSNL